MGLVTKNLPAVNDNITTSLPDEANGTFTFQYPVSGAGTIVPEVTLNNIDWVAINCTNINTGVQSTSVAAAGIYVFEFTGYFAARIRKSVGVAACLVSVSVAFN